MDAEGKFWFNCWVLVAVSLILAIACSCLYYSGKNARIAAAPDPIAAACAMGEGGSREPLCMVYVVNRGKKD